jgi:hypothetical protein
MTQSPESQQPRAQLKRDAAYIRKQAHERQAHESTGAAASSPLTAFDEEIYNLLSTAHTVVSVANTLSPSKQRPADLEERVAASMQRLLQADRIQLSPDS